MTKVSEQILQHIQEILDVEIPKNLHPVVEKIVRIFAIQVGNDEAVVQCLKDLNLRLTQIETKK